MNEDLRKWFSQKWVDISRKKKGGGHPPCGASADKGVRAKDSSKKYPKCVPANKAKNMSKKQKKSAVTRKRRAPNEPGSPDFVKTDVKKESWENWKPRRGKVYPGGAPSNNAPENPEPMGGAIAFEKNRKEVLALKEMIKHIVQDLLKEEEKKTPKLGFGRANPPARPPAQVSAEGIPTEDPNEISDSELQNIFAANDFADHNIQKIAYKFYKILDRGESSKYADIVDNLPNIEKFNSIINKLEQPRVARGIPAEEKTKIKTIVGKLSSGIEAELEKREREKLFKQPAPAPTSVTSPKKQKTIETKNVTKAVNYVGSKDIKDSFAELVQHWKQSGKDQGEISKLINTITRDILTPNFEEGKSTTETALDIRNAINNPKYSGKEMPYLGAPKISPQQQGFGSRVKGLLGLNEEQAKQLMERYDIRTESDYDIFIEAIALVLKEGN